MAIIKHISIKNSPLDLLKYITGEKKDKEVKLITGLNCSEEAMSAYLEMDLCYRTFAGESFAKKQSTEGKQKIKMHHYIQSFKNGEVTSEKAHEIAIKWAKEVFGNNQQILIATHEDTEHIHTHFAVNAYDFKGRHQIDNKKTLQACRDVSDKIVKSYGLSVIENSSTKKNYDYAEWLARQDGTSWKEKLCDDIDNLILRDSVKTVSNLVSELRKIGYTVNYGKYISVKPTYLKNRKAVRTYRLGNGYGIEELQYRIDNKNREMPLAAVMKYEGIQREYALCLRELQISIYRKPENPYKASYSELRKNAELLTYICENNICTKENFKNRVNIVAKEADNVINSYKNLQIKIKDCEFLIEHRERYFELNKIDLPLAKEKRELSEIYNVAKKYNFSKEEDIQRIAAELEQARAEFTAMQGRYEKAKKDKKTAADNCETLLRQLDSDYANILKSAKKEFAEYEKSTAVALVSVPKISFIQRVREISEWSDKVQKKTEISRLNEQIKRDCINRDYREN